MSTGRENMGVRPNNDKKAAFFIQDDENTMNYKPIDMHLNKFFGTWSQAMTLG